MRLKDSIKYWIYRIAFWLISLLSIRILYALSDVIYFLLYKLGHYRIKIVRQNLKSSFPEKSKDELLTLEKAFYHQLCDNIIEGLKMLSMSERQLKNHIDVVNPEVVEAIAARKKPIILFLGHLGNWEWAQALKLYYDRPEISAVVYKPLRDKAFDRLLQDIRGGFGTVLIPQKSAYREILKMSRTFESLIVGFIADHRSNSSLSAHHVDFLNHITPFNVGAEKIGSHIGAEYLYLRIIKTDRGKYQFELVAIVPDVLEGDFPYTREYYRLLEDNIRRQPQLWLWSHRRWLYS